MFWKMDVEKYESKPERYHKIAVRDTKVYYFGAKKDDNFIVDYHNKKYITYKPNIRNKEMELFLEEELDCSRFGWNNGWKKFVKEGNFSYSEECFIDNYPNFANICSKYEKSRDLTSHRSPHIGTFIIPKGTEYYENEDGEIMSAQLIWTGEYICNKKINERTNRLKYYVLENKYNKI